jgi:hypothetical protein
MGRETSKRIIAVTAIILFGAWACRSNLQNLNRTVESAPPAVSQSAFDIVDSKVIEVISPFDHTRRDHKTKSLDCSACHVRANNDPKPVMPGHPACIECHLRDFTSKEPKMCIVCHRMPLDAQFSRTEFPARLTQFGIRAFSHRDHSNSEKMRNQMDMQMMPEGAPKCDFCHRFDDLGLKASMPEHPECYSCHEHQPNEKLDACVSCHIRKSGGMQYYATPGRAFTLYNFKHGPHLKKADCDKCHLTVEVPAGQPQPDILAINTAPGQRHHSSCWNCHVESREAVCSKCHTQPF